MDYVKLIRTVRPSENGVFEIDVYSLCKLVDALSNGNLLNYLDYYVVDNKKTHMTGFGVNPELSIERMSRYISNRIKPNDAQRIFGNVNLLSSKDYECFLLRSKGYEKDNIYKEIRRYIIDNFEVADGTLVRCPRKININV